MYVDIAILLGLHEIAGMRCLALWSSLDFEVPGIFCAVGFLI
jgi:hypothetical protein